jgi:hypothetical protein
MPRPPRAKVVKGSTRAGAGLQSKRPTRTKQTGDTTRPETGEKTKPRTLADAPSNKLQYVLASDPIDISVPVTEAPLAINRRSARTSNSKPAMGPEGQTSLTKTKAGRSATEHAPAPKSRPVSRRQSPNNSVTGSVTARQRQRTPTRASSIDSDLYGLSPGGEISRAKLEASALSVSQSRSNAATGSRRPSFSRRGSMLRGARATPGMDSSVLALNHFKRRARKPSIIRFTNTAQNSEVEDNDFAGDLSLGLSELGSDGFNPVGESTPLNIGKARNPTTRTSTAGTSVLSSATRKRKFDETTAPEIVVVASSPPLSSPRETPSRDEDSLPERGAHSEADALPAAGSVEAEPLSDTMGPPMSSESGDRSPVMTNSQEVAARKKIRLNQPTTEQLELLLPKMPRKRPVRATRKDIYELSDSPLESVDREPEDDESDIVESIESEDERVSTKTNRRGAATSRRQATKSPAQVKRKKQPSVLADSRNKGNARRKVKSSVETSKPGTSPKKSARRRTYGSRNNANKENDEEVSFLPELDESIVIVQEAARDTALTAMRKKFEEVDEWEMEFEEVEGELESGWR